MICLPCVVKSGEKKEELSNLLMRFDDLHNQLLQNLKSGSYFLHVMVTSKI